MQNRQTHPFRFFAVGMLLTATLAGCQQKTHKVAKPLTEAPRQTSPEPTQGNVSLVSSSKLEVLARGINAFTFDLYRTLASTNGNIFFSPWSISMALAMAHLGARGTTAEEMEQTLHFPRKHLDAAFAMLTRKLTEKQPEGMALEMANRLFPQKGFPILPAFPKALARYYATAVQSLDYRQTLQAVSTINAWVKAQTKGRIPNLLNPADVDKMTRLVLVNTIFFKGTWQHPFLKEATKPEPFYPGGGKQAQVDMMHAVFKTGYHETLDFQALELPYTGGKLSMVVFLPRSRDGLPDLEKKMDAKLLQSTIAAMPRTKVIIALPKFHAQQRVTLKSKLEELGIKRLFIPGQADLSGIADKKTKLYVSGVIHQANCDVDEKGTVAAAATALVGKGAGMPRPGKPHIFRADHPFLFFIRDNDSGAILFMGRIVKP